MATQQYTTDHWYELGELVGADWARVLGKGHDVEISDGPKLILAREVNRSAKEAGATRVTGA